MPRVSGKAPRRPGPRDTPIVTATTAVPSDLGQVVAADGIRGAAGQPVGDTLVTGAGGGLPPRLPWNDASPKAKMPPSSATIR